MNCLDFRRLVDTDPGCVEPAFIEHRAECPGCAAFAARSEQFDRQLRAAARFDVPENLASRILLREALKSRTASRPRRRTMLAIAASALLCLGLALGSWTYLDRGPGLDEEMVALIQAAPYALQATGPVETIALKAALRPIGLSVRGDFGRVTFASRCYVRGLLSGHVVVRGKSAPITVFLVPTRLTSVRTLLKSAALAGVIVPVERGTIAIIGAPGEALEEHERRILQAVRFEV